MRLTVDVQGTSAIDGVSMTWSGPAGSVTNDLNNEGGTQWGLDFTISSLAKPGQRQITVQATDAKGSIGTAPAVKLNLVP